MADNERYVARVPIVPDDFENQNSHKNNELVMDFQNEDIYVKKNNGYVNITGKIKEDVKEIQDGSSIIHVVTDRTIPPVKDRSENNWYYVITNSETIGPGGGGVASINYIYYGLIKSYYTNKNYLLIAQNMTSGPSTVQFEILDGYCPCFYVPINYGASFKNNRTGEDIEFTIEDRIYALNNSSGTYISYDVYILQLSTPGTYFVDIDLTGSNYFKVSFDTNDENVDGLVLPDTMNIRDGDCIGEIEDPTWTNPRYLFKGWSIDKISKTLINPLVYKPESNITLYAWFEYNEDPSMLTYYSNYESNGGD